MEEEKRLTEASAILEELDHAAGKIEFDSILDMLAGYARSERSRARILSMRTLSSTEQIEESQGDISELVGLRDGGEDLPLSGWKDSWHLVNRINAEGAVASSEELTHIAEGELIASGVDRFLASRGERLALLSRYRSGFIIQEELIERIQYAIGPDFEVLDRASSKLSKIRKQVTSLRNGLRKDFADFAARRSMSKGYEFVTVRGERYVVSLPRGEASRIKGIIHQTSASGASLYIEPLEFVDDNNRLESLIQEERREIERILQDLTAEVFRRREMLLGNQDTLLLLDVVSSKASLARRFRCMKPEHSTDGTLVLCGARHPLLEKRFAEEGKGNTVTPLDLRCDSSLRALVISGPNAGGKTVALKTVGLLVVMDRAGLLIPSREGTRIPVYDKVFVDIGDDQSIEKSLSTFSSRIVRIKKILELVDENSIVLIDEIGDGTNPEEGAALAEAVLDRLIGLCGMTIVTTHLSSLKGWAHEMEGAANATLEFDSERLVPLYNLRMGVPGRSWGIEMAGRLGLPSDIVGRAKDAVGMNVLRLEELLAHLESMESEVRKEREELLKKERMLSELTEAYRDRVGSLEENRDRLLQEARKEALDIVSSTRKEMENLIREIRTTQAERSAIRDAKERVSRRRADFEGKLEKRSAAPGVVREDLRPGMWLEIMSLGQVGKVMSVKDSSRVYLELRGGLRVETGVEDLSPCGDIDEKDDRRKSSWTVDHSEPVSSELMVRGMERGEALERIDAFIDKAVLQGLSRVVIIHGIGRGVLKRAIYKALKGDPRVADVHPGQPALGGDGVAVVELR